jgi:uncharacterized oxidoreductase
MMKMQGHTILVAGGTDGMVRGLAELLCRLGNEVLVLSDMRVPGLRNVELDLADPWSVAGFAEQVAAICPGLNMLVNIDIAFPVRHLPGLDALLDGDDSQEKQEAQRLGLQHLTGALLPQLRKRAHGAVFQVCVGPRLAPPAARPVLDGGLQGSAVAVSKRWARASVDVVDVAPPSQLSRSTGVARAEFMSTIAHLLAEGLQETAALSRLQALWPAARPKGVPVQPAAWHTASML